LLLFYNFYNIFIYYFSIWVTKSVNAIFQQYPHSILKDLTAEQLTFSNNMTFSKKVRKVSWHTKRGILTTPVSLLLIKTDC
ncbi:hypothetical protein C0J52_25805, partial [Blattella germanica]